MLMVTDYIMYVCNGNLHLEITNFSPMEMIKRLPSDVISYLTAR